MLNFSKRLLNEFPDWLLFNCRTQLIIPSGPIVDRVSMRSLVVVEVTCMISHIRLLQSSISQLSEYNKLEEKLHSIVFDRMLILL